jgi:hypothetical protein
MNRQIPSTLGDTSSDNTASSNDPSSSSPPDNPYNVSLSLRLGLIAGIITTIGDALAVYAARISIDEEIASNFDTIKSQEEQDSRFSKLENQMAQLQKQLELLNEPNKK